MYSERMQILLTPEQRRRLEIEAKRLGVSVASVVREAIDGRVDAIPSDRRAAALERLSRRRVAFVPVAKLGELIDTRNDMPPAK